MYVPADVAADEGVLKACETARSLGDFFSHNPNADTTWNRRSQNCRQHLFGVELIAFVISQIVIGRAGDG